MITSVPGFKAGGLAAGIKESGAPDLAMVATVDGGPVTAAGVFTNNLVAAAPVQISRQHLADGRAAAVILNSGNANAATGERGRADALRMCELTALAVGCSTGDVLVGQTGLIGIPMPMDPIESGIPKLGAQLTADATGGAAAAAAMMTTDTVPKT
ncbi:MAG TPA: bifunctional ornithine acetyltransferase/N-acetylglutamate synthase, partial [Acidimicrobiia bacterium]|nr:bifunctional ornithine acetyltransferase/N-acetylglutamate synthase [Acidimicrobiia bacterium]